MDLQVVETGNGGDLNGKGNDLVVVFSLENMVYLGMFGGNVEASTAPRIESEQAFDWWGNTVIFKNSPEQQFNSQTERVLNNTTLNSAGRLAIIEAVKADLAFMKPFANVTVDAEIESDDRVRLDIAVVKPDNLEEKQYTYIWEAGQLNFIDTDYTAPTLSEDEGGLQYEVQFSL